MVTQIQDESSTPTDPTDKYQSLLNILRENKKRSQLYSIPHKTLEASRQEIKDLEVERRGRESYFMMRKTWSWALVGFLGILILFQITLTFLIGRGILSFTSYKLYLGSVITENFFQIIGLCWLVVQFLFPKKE